MFQETMSMDTLLNGPLTGIAARQHGFESQAMRQAIALFREARFQARLARLGAALTGQAHSLCSLAQVTGARTLGDRHDAGTQTVAISRIHGSENRCHDFDRDFLPLQEHSRERWLSVARARLSGVALPAVTLVQVRDEYYVCDGHHRISVAKALGENFIEAEVTVWQ